MKSDSQFEKQVWSCLPHGKDNSCIAQVQDSGGLRMKYAFFMFVIYFVIVQLTSQSKIIEIY